jgi:hypothetical protein
MAQRVLENNREVHYDTCYTKTILIRNKGAYHTWLRRTAKRVKENKINAVQNERIHLIYQIIQLCVHNVKGVAGCAAREIHWRIFG